MTKPVEAKDVKKSASQRRRAEDVKGAEPAPARTEAAGLTGTAAKPATVDAAVKPAVRVAATPAAPRSAAKTAKAPAPAKPVIVIQQAANRKQ